MKRQYYANEDQMRTLSGNSESRKKQGGPWGEDKRFSSSRSGFESLPGHNFL